ncbi:sugar ABC transporter permease [Kaistia dalseonensis]|uniref:ABC-type sugar transport system permease subunit n=1 Tax=Kaistia dalseonensis TaxID=410840 RepID=A0ABU0H4H1_9HYPH|nr:sugar ABC transporter permease [Kaistia dalseonensis]MCX5494619.1 sugar ABC transporter permease [Kaistia dalseonensis]MDQ0437199.1 ABC-type sugar transport system permease subunit [Kaistia dalseonensis]
MTGIRKWTFTMLAPGIGLIAVFILVPMALTVALAFTKWSSQTPFSTATFIGLDNFAEIFGSSSVGRDFKGALINTALYALLSIALILPLSILFGMLIHQAQLRGANILRTILFATYMVPMIAVALVFSKLYSPSEGPFNQMLGWVGIGPQPWLSSPDTALVSVVLLNVWQQVGYFTILIIAGLTQIPPSLYDAARIDGARGLNLFGFITLPLLRRTLLFSAVIALINAVQVFEPVALITQGGPVGSTNVMTYYIRRVGIERAQGGLGSAMSVTLLLALVVTVTAVFALARREPQR